MKQLRLLAIGNSLAENPLTYLPALADSAAGIEVIVGHATLAGCPLVKHWRLAEYSRMHPEFRPYHSEAGGSAYGSTDKAWSLHEALVAKPWDAITLNHASIPGPRRETFQPWLGHLHALITAAAPQAELFLNMTWAYREDAPYLIENGLSSDSMHQLLRDNYRHYAVELGCRIIPTGEAIQAFRRRPGRAFVFPDPAYNYLHPTPPALPQQKNSLSVGWNWNLVDTPDGSPQLQLDPNHLNAAGLYLAGCTWLGSLTGIDPRKARFRPLEIDEAFAAELREIAHESCAAYEGFPGRTGREGST